MNATHSNLIARWRLDGNAEDTGGKFHGLPARVAWTQGPAGAPAGAALFNGRDSRITIPHAAELQLGARDFTCALWAKCARPMTGVFGDLLSKFDAERRCGFNFWVAGSHPGYQSMSDTRHVHFGVDDGYLGDWLDCGRPWPSNPLVTCLVAHGGELYAGLADAERPEDACKVFRWKGGKEWEDCGRLGQDPHHLSVQAMLVHDGKLYAGTGIWDWTRAGQASAATPPQALTRVFCYAGGTVWRDLGQVGAGARVLCLASFQGELYAGLDRGGGGGCFKYAGGRWEDCGVLAEKDNFECLLPLGGVLYGASHTAVYRYAGGRNWECIGRQPHGITQIHSFCMADGKLWIGTWPQGFVLRHEGGAEWSNTGRLGLATDQEGIKPINEINALAHHNGKLYAGVLPKAQVYRYESDGHWTLLGSLARRPEWDQEQLPTWLRVLAFTTHRGKLFACTGACQARARDVDRDQTVGRVLACEAGQVVSHEHDIGGDWTHLAAVRQGRRLKLFVNGRPAAASLAPKARTLNLMNAQPLRIGSGAQGAFNGALADVRLYGRALIPRQIAALAGGAEDIRPRP